MWSSNDGLFGSDVQTRVTPFGILSPTVTAAARDLHGAAAGLKPSASRPPCESALRTPTTTSAATTDSLAACSQDPLNFSFNLAFDPLWTNDSTVLLAHPPMALVPPLHSTVCPSASLSLTPPASPSTVQSSSPSLAPSLWLDRRGHHLSVASSPTELSRSVPDLHTPHRPYAHLTLPNASTQELGQPTTPLADSPSSPSSLSSTASTSPRVSTHEADSASLLPPLTRTDSAMRHRSNSHLDPEASNAQSLPLVPVLKRSVSTENLGPTVASIVATDLGTSPTDIRRLASVRRESRRDRAVQELIDTERVYLQKLSVLLEVFYLPLRSLLTTHELQRLFGNLEALITCSTQLLSLLEAQQEEEFVKNIPMRVGEIFMSLAEAFECYGDYSPHYSNATQFLAARRREDDQVDQLLQKAGQNPRCGRLDLASFLLEPVQRLPRYAMLLQQIVHFTKPNHPDHFQLRLAADMMRDVGEKVNEMTRVQLDRDKCQEIADSVDFSGFNLTWDTHFEHPLLGRRHFVCEGNLVKWRGNRRLTFYLFNDVVLLVKTSRVSLSKQHRELYRKPWRTNQIMVRPVEPKPYMPDPKCFFEIVDIAAPETILFQAPDRSLARKWMADIATTCQTHYRVEAQAKRESKQMAKRLTEVRSRPSTSSSVDTLSSATVSNRSSVLYVTTKTPTCITTKVVSPTSSRLPTRSPSLLQSESQASPTATWAGRSSHSSNTLPDTKPTGNRRNSIVSFFTEAFATTGSTSSSSSPSSASFANTPQPVPKTPTTSPPHTAAESPAATTAPPLASQNTLLLSGVTPPSRPMSLVSDLDASFVTAYCHQDWMNTLEQEATAPPLGEVQAITNANPRRQSMPAPLPPSHSQQASSTAHSALYHIPPRSDSLAPTELARHYDRLRPGPAPNPRSAHLPSPAMFVPAPISLRRSHSPQQRSTLPTPIVTGLSTTPSTIRQPPTPTKNPGHRLPLQSISITSPAMNQSLRLDTQLRGSSSPISSAATSPTSLLTPATAPLIRPLSRPLVDDNPVGRAATTTHAPPPNLARAATLKKYSTMLLAAAHSRGTLRVVVLEAESLMSLDPERQRSDLSIGSSNDWDDPTGTSMMAIPPRSAHVIRTRASSISHLNPYCNVVLRMQNKDPEAPGVSTDDPTSETTSLSTNSSGKGSTSASGRRKSSWFTSTSASNSSRRRSPGNGSTDTNGGEDGPRWYHSTRLSSLMGNATFSSKRSTARARDCRRSIDVVTKPLTSGVNVSPATMGHMAARARTRRPLTLLPLADASAPASPDPLKHQLQQQEQRTRTVYRTRHPKWHEAMVFCLTRDSNPHFQQHQADNRARLNAIYHPGRPVERTKTKASSSALGSSSRPSMTSQSSSVSTLSAPQSAASLKASQSLGCTEFIAPSRETLRKLGTAPKLVITVMSEDPQSDADEYLGMAELELTSSLLDALKNNDDDEAAESAGGINQPAGAHGVIRLRLKDAPRAFILVQLSYHPWY
ncbi:hypothetical protein H4R34_002182 [Dimargaris verticillata]|uniref:DH domain-containing protein n=1 Tax=Dimargaris verticillata TaxID=2761393 RepID=A0A9W8B381_9FUNG|nr:hypothetical protein H4R34_002182 [Dimargaris verticillata]